MSPTVRTPRRSRRARVAGPTPHSARAGRGRRKASSDPAATTCTPSPGSGPVRVARGFAASDASLATIFVAATPTEQVRPSSASTSSRMAAPDAGPVAERPERAGDVEERLVEAERLDEGRVRPEDRHHPPADLAHSGRGRRAGTRRGGRDGGPGRWAWPRRCRRPGPRSWRPRRRPGRRCRRRRPAGPAARGAAAARRTRRTRPCRRGGWCAAGPSPPAPGAAAPGPPGTLPVTARSPPGDDRPGRVVAVEQVAERRCRRPPLGQPGRQRLAHPRVAPREVVLRTSPGSTNAASTTMPSGSSTRRGPEKSTATWASTRRCQPSPGASTSTS